MKYTEIETINELSELLLSNKEIKTFAFQNLDFNIVEDQLASKEFSDCIFLGCEIPKSMSSLISENCLIFPQIDVPFNPFIAKLYNKQSLYGNYTLGKPDTYDITYDKIVYNHYIKHGKEADDIKQTLSRRLHDHSITDAMYDFLADFDEKKVVAIMGGYSLSRVDESFYEAAKISKKLTEKGYLMVSGGGPGAMEATHVGAWFAGKTETDLKQAIEVLSEAPVYNHKLWLDKAFEVLHKFPNSEYNSLGIPTWLYGHEPPTPFATHIAKYFANSVREDGLLTIAKGGIIFSPGSAGTIQEIFQDATQNHYLSFGYASPMVFLNTDYWTIERPIYPLLTKMNLQGKYKNLILSIFDNCNDVVTEIEKFVK